MTSLMRLSTTLLLLACSAASAQIRGTAHPRATYPESSPADVVPTQLPSDTDPNALTDTRTSVPICSLTIPDNFPEQIPGRPDQLSALMTQLATRVQREWTRPIPADATQALRARIESARRPAIEEAARALLGRGVIATIDVADVIDDAALATVPSSAPNTHRRPGSAGYRVTGDVRAPGTADQGPSLRDRQAMAAVDRRYKSELHGLSRAADPDASYAPSALDPTANRRAAFAQRQHDMNAIRQDIASRPSDFTLDCTNSPELTIGWKKGQARRLAGYIQQVDVSIANDSTPQIHVSLRWAPAPMADVTPPVQDVRR